MTRFKIMQTQIAVDLIVMSQPNNNLTFDYCNSNKTNSSDRDKVT